MKITSIIVFSFFIVIQSFSQTKKTVDSLRNERQKCFDKGQYMLGCSINFYNQMDSLLNVVYFKLYHSFDTSNQTNLKKEQRLWHAKRNKTFELNARKIRAEALREGFEGGLDEKMILTDENAFVVKQRVLELIGRLESNFYFNKYI